MLTKVDCNFIFILFFLTNTAYEFCINDNNFLQLLCKMNQQKYQPILLILSRLKFS